MTYLVRPNPAILEISPYVAGESKIAGVEKIIKLASNESPLGPSPKAIAAFEAQANRMALYPDSNHAELRAVLGEVHGLDPEQLIASNGSETLIDLAVRCFAGPGDEVLFPKYSFPLYPIVARAAGARPVEADTRDYGTDIDALLAKVSDKTKIVMVANPNNPTGTWVGRRAIERLRAQLPEQTLLIIDSAYAEYMDDADYAAGHALVTDAKPNVLVTRTLSKAYGLAALRVGWAHGGRPILDILRRVRATFPITAPSLAAAAAALGDRGHLRKAVAHNADLLPWFRGELARRGIETPPDPRGNFLLALFGAPEKAAQADAVLRGSGIIARRTAAPGSLRISIGLRSDMEAVLAALDAAPAFRHSIASKAG